MNKILAFLGAIPILALFGGIGILAYRISNTWDAATTQALVTGLTVICGGGALVLCLLLALIVGVPLAIRAYGEGGLSRRQWREESQHTRPALPRFDDWPPISPKRQPTALPYAIDGQWSRFPDPSSSAQQPTSTLPPWGATGGGQTQLLPPPTQDERFGMEQ